MSSATDFNDAEKGLYAKRLRQFKEGAWRDFEDIIAPEVPVRLLWPGVEPKTLLAFPDSEAGLRRLALGHAANRQRMMHKPSERLMLSAFDQSPPRAGREQPRVREKPARF